MATSSISTQFRLPAYYPYNQTFAATQGRIYTDTETQPASAGPTSVEVVRPVVNRQTLSKKRTIPVQTKVFRTDYSSASDFSSCYTNVSEDVL